VCAALHSLCTNPRTSLISSSLKQRNEE
jgi:hypothetical protein